MEGRTSHAPILKTARGFTLIEAVVVVLIIGVIGAVVVGRFVFGGTDLAARTSTIKTHLRYARGLSMNSDTVWGIHCANDGTSYWLFKDGDNTRKSLLPGEEAETVGLSGEDITLSGFSNLSFNSWGVPFTDAAASSSKLTATLNISVSSGGETRTITITPNTGFIP